MKYLLLVLALLLPFGCQKPPPTPERTEISQQTLASLKYSVATIHISTLGFSAGTGTAFAISPTLLVTAQHVCEYPNWETYEVKNKHFTAHLQPVRTSAREDICVLQGYHGLKPLKVRQASLKEGEKIWVYGSPYGFPNTITFGYAGTKEWLGWHFGTKTRIHAPIAPGNSGGPVVDKNGHVVGIAVVGLNGYSHVNWSVQHEALKVLTRP